MKRREFLKKTGQAVSLAAVTGGVGYLFHNRQLETYAGVTTLKTDFTVADNVSLPRIALVRNYDPTSALKSALDLVGGIGRFIHPGERVTIKPNVGWDRTPAQAANTNPDLVAEMVRQCLKAGADEVIVTDVTCNDPRRCFIRSGIGNAARQAGARVIMPTPEDFVQVDLKGRILSIWPVLKYFVQTDRLINMPIVKNHSLSRCTLGMKNLYGILGGRRNQLHQQIDQSIVDLACYARPTLTVVDATRVLLRSGPQGGSLDDVAIENSVICATDQVAADARAAEFLGLTGADVGHITLAAATGLGNIDYRATGYKETTS